MIRSNVPMPLLFRLRMRANWVARRAQSGLTSYRQRGGFEAERAIWTKKVGGRQAAECSPALWSEFVDQYEKFTGALCSAAKDGCTAVVEREYASARRWFGHYYPVVATRVRPFLDAEFEVDAANAVTAMSKRQKDALESMFQSASLRDMLQRDNGDLIPRIARISDAVYRCHASFEAR
jgi:hypothetical protein